LAKKLAGRLCYGHPARGILSDPLEINPGNYAVALFPSLPSTKVVRPVFLLELTK